MKEERDNFLERAKVDTRKESKREKSKAHEGKGEAIRIINWFGWFLSALAASLAESSRRFFDLTFVFRSLGASSLSERLIFTSRHSNP